MRKWRNCTFLHSVQRSLSLLSNTQFLQESKLKALSRVGTTVFELYGSVESFVDGCHIMTTHSFGNVRDGLHPMQEDITNNETQCGFLHSWLGDEHVFTIGE